MAKRIAVPFKDTKLRIIGPAGATWARRVQRLDMPANLPNTVINELGNANHAGTVTDVPDVTATFNAFDATHETFAYLTGNSPTAYPASGVDISSLKCVDLGLYVREESVAENLKCIHMKKMQITGFTWSYSTDGEASEEYTAGGSEKRYLKYDLVVDESTAGTDAFVFSQTAIQLKNTNYTLSVIKDGVYQVEGTDFVAGAAGITSGLGITWTKLVVVYHANATAAYTYLTDASLSPYPAAIRGKNIPVTISSEHQYRVQSVSVRGEFPNTRITEMGNVNAVGYIVDPPNVTGDISFLGTDLEIVALLAQGTKTGGAEVEFGPDEYEERKLPLKIELLNPADNITVFKTVYIPYLRITSDGTSSNVGDRLTQTFAFQSDDGQCLVYSGAMP